MRYMPWIWNIFFETIGAQDDPAQLVFTCRQGNYFIKKKGKNGDGAQVQVGGMNYWICSFLGFFFFTKEY